MGANCTLRAGAGALIRKSWGLYLLITRAQHEAARGVQIYREPLKLWTVPYELMYITGHNGRTHLVASAPENAPTLVLLHVYFTSLTQWAANIADLSRSYRVYAIDDMGRLPRLRCTQDTSRSAGALPLAYFYAARVLSRS